MSVFKKITKPILIIFFICVAVIKIMDLVISLPAVLSMACLALVASSLVLIYKYRENLSRKASVLCFKINSFKTWKVISLLLLISLIFKLLALIITNVDARYVNVDIWVYEQSAKEISQSGMIQTYAAYAYNFSHIMWFSIFLSPVEFLFGGDQTAYCIYFIFISLLTQFFLFFTLSKILSKAKATLIIGITSLLPSQMLLPQFITHEIPAFMFVSMSLWLLFVVFPKATTISGKIMICGVFCISLIFGIFLNSASLVFCVALFLYLAFYKSGKKERKFRVQKIVLCTLVIASVASTFPISNCVKKGILDYEDERKPMSSVQWTLYVGANINTNAGFGVEDVHRFAWPADIGLFELEPNDKDNLYLSLDDEELYKYRNDLILERYGDLLHNPVNLAKLLSIKFGKIWSYFNYPYVAIKALYPERAMYEPIFNFCIAAESVLQILSLVLMIFAVVKKKARYTDEYYLFGLYVVGMSLLLMLSECNSKYTIPLQIVFWIICVMPHKNKTEEALLEKK